VAWADNRTGESDIAFQDLTNGKTVTLTKPGSQTDPKVYGNYIAYLNNHTDINLYNILTGADLSLAPGSIKMEPAISDRGVVWTDYKRGPKDPDIQMYDFKILADIPITSGPFNHTNPSISGDNIVWTDNRNGQLQRLSIQHHYSERAEHNQHRFRPQQPGCQRRHVIWTDKSRQPQMSFLYDLKTKKTVQVTTDASDHLYGMIGGNNIIWIDTRSGGEQIYLYDIATGKEQQITTVKSFKHSPVMAGDKIVWIDSRNGEDKWDVYLYNLTSHEEIPICTNSARQVQPWIYGDTVVWADGRNKNWDIYTYNLTTKTEQPVVTNSANQGYPMIYGDYIAWLDVRQGDPDIYLYDTKKDVEVPGGHAPTGASAQRWSWRTVQR